MGPKQAKRIREAAEQVAKVTMDAIKLESDSARLNAEIAKIRQDAEIEIERVRLREKAKIEAAEQRRIELERARREKSELRARMEEECGTAGLIMADLLWEKAWEHGHASGYADVEYWYRDLAELVR